MFGVYELLLTTALMLFAVQSDAATVSTDASMIANGWYAERHAVEFPVKDINWDYYTQITYVWA